MRRNWWSRTHSAVTSFCAGRPPAAVRVSFHEPASCSSRSSLTGCPRPSKGGAAASSATSSIHVIENLPAKIRAGRRKDPPTGPGTAPSPSEHLLRDLDLHVLQRDA